MKNYYLVDEDYLPKSLRQTILVKEMLAKDSSLDLAGALNKVGLAKSTYYKYKDTVFSFYNLGNREIVNLSVSLRNEPGVLSGVLNRIAKSGGNVLTINQGLPTMGEALVTVSVGMTDSTIPTIELVQKLSKLQGVIHVNVDGVQNS